MLGILYQRSDIGCRCAKDVAAKCAKWGTNHNSENVVSSKFEAATQQQNVAADLLGFDRPMTFSPDSPLLLFPILPFFGNTATLHTLLLRTQQDGHALPFPNTLGCVSKIRGNDTPLTHNARAKP